MTSNFDPATVAILGVGVTLLGGVCAAIGSYKDSKKIGGMAAAITFMATALTGYGTYISQKQSDEDQASLAEQTKSIERLNLKMHDYITGGDSFCFVILPADGALAGAANLTLQQQGETPVYDVTIRIVDADKETWTYRGLAKSRVHVGTVTKGELVVLEDEISFQPGDVSRNFNFFISTRNGFYVQKIRMRKVSGQWESATRIYRTKNPGFLGVPIHHEKTPNFPALDEKVWE